MATTHTQEKMNNLPFNETSDIWSLGCTLYELCNLQFWIFFVSLNKLLFAKN